MGGDVFFIYVPTAVHQGRWGPPPPARRRTRRRGTRPELQVRRLRREISRVYCALFVKDAHAWHGRHMLLYRFSGAARGIIRWEPTYWGDLGPHGVLLAYVGRSSRGLRAAERALRPRVRRHPARGLHPKPPAIYRSVGRRATRGGILWVRVGLAEQPRRLIDATRGHGEAASGSRIFIFYLFVACCWPSGLCRSTQRSERGRRGRK